MSASDRAIRDASHALVVFICAAFAVVASGSGYWALGQAGALSRHPANPRVATFELLDPRGAIVTADGLVLAGSVPTADGYRRIYHKRAPAPLVGYVSPLYGDGGLERMYRSQLLALAKEKPTWGVLRITLDSRLQSATEAALGDRRGSAVVISGDDGAVLVYVSQPAFDPNALTDRRSQEAAWKELDQRAKATGMPLLDSVVGRVAEPGAVFLPIAAGVLMGCGTDPREAVSVNGPYQANATWDTVVVRPTSGLTGAFDLTAALRHREVVPLAAQAPRVGGACFAEALRRFGIGPAQALDRPTRLATAAAGTDGVPLSPMQLALVLAPFTNGGLLVEPRFVADQVPTSRRILPPSTAELIRLALTHSDRIAVLDAHLPGGPSWAVGLTATPRPLVAVVALEGGATSAEARAAVMAVIDAADRLADQHAGSPRAGSERVR